MTWTGPPSGSTRFRWAVVAKPSARPSGDQNTRRASSVPGIRRVGRRVERAQPHRGPFGAAPGNECEPISGRRRHGRADEDVQRRCFDGERNRRRGRCGARPSAAAAASPATAAPPSARMPPSACAWSVRQPVRPRRRRDPSARRRCRAGAASGPSRDSASSRRTRARCRGGQRREIRLALDDLAIMSEARLARERRAGRQHLVEHAAERPDVGPLVDRQAARLLRAHVGGGAGDQAAPPRAAIDRGGDACLLGSRPRSTRFGEAEVEHLDRAVGRSLTLAGFRSRWMTPFSCAASSAAAICRAISSASVDRERAAGESVGERLAFDELEHKAACRRRPRCRRSSRCSGGSATRGVAPRARSARAAPDPCEALGQHLERDVATEPRVARAKNLRPYLPRRSAPAPRTFLVVSPARSILSDLGSSALRATRSAHGGRHARLAIGDATSPKAKGRRSVSGRRCERISRQSCRSCCRGPRATAPSSSTTIRA